VSGVRHIAREVQAANNVYQGEGALSLEVIVDESGKAESVVVRESPDKNISQAVSDALMNEHYKPGKCQGVPCKMPYRIHFNLS
jgi:hypothetical protein